MRLITSSRFFQQEYHSRQDAPFLSTGGVPRQLETCLPKLIFEAYFLVKLLLHYPQPGLTTLCLSNQATWRFKPPLTDSVAYMLSRRSWHGLRGEKGLFLPFTSTLYNLTKQWRSLPKAATTFASQALASDLQAAERSLGLLSSILSKLLPSRLSFDFIWLKT